MTVDEAITGLLRRYPEAFVVSTCGYVSRDLFRLRDSPRHFYMLGSMGIAAPLALGVAIGRPDATTLVLDGDAAFVMNLGAAAMIAAEMPPRLVHAVLDNGVHESTGAQRAVPMPRSPEALRALGYAQARVATDAGSLAALPEGSGPLLVRIPVARRPLGPGGRVSREPRTIAADFARALRATARAEVHSCA